MTFFEGRDRINRALDGDIVAVELIQPGEISKYSSIALHPSESLQASVSIAEDTAVPTAADIEGLKHSGGRISLFRVLFICYRQGRSRRWYHPQKLETICRIGSTR